MTNLANSVSTILGAAAGEQMRVSLFINHDIANRFYQSRSPSSKRLFPSITISRNIVSATRKRNYNRRVDDGSG